MNIIEAIHDEHLFRPFLGDDLSSWKNWFTALRVVYGLPVNAKRSEVILQCTGRKIDQLPKAGFDTALFLTGRRSGKSRMAALIAAYESALGGKEKLLSKGETGLVAVIAPTKRQSTIVRNYIRAIFKTDLLEAEIESEDKETFRLSNGVHITVLVGDFRSVRGFTLLAVVIDEVAFFGLDEESKVRSDSELIRAIKPSLITVGGRLIAISTPYARKGWCWKTYQQYFGNDAGSVLVWNCPSKTMNSTLPQKVIDEAMADDMQAAKSEYLGEFRDDVCVFLPREVIEAVVVRGRKELLPKTEYQYFAFADVSGGRSDDAALAIGHKSHSKVVVDLLRRYKPPFSPQEVIRLMSEEAKNYHIRCITGDNYAAEYTAQAFQACGMLYKKSDKAKGQLYLELLPRLSSGEIELLDDEFLINQLASLERRTRSGGRDVIDHPPNGHDDLANSVAGLSDIASIRVVKVGGIGVLWNK